MRYQRGYKVNFKLISKPVKLFPFKNSGFSTFGAVLGDGLILLGLNRGIYQYILSEDKWVEAMSPEVQEHTRSRAQGCSLGPEVYVLCGGDLEKRVEVLKVIKQKLQFIDDDGNLGESSLSRILKNTSHLDDIKELSSDESKSVTNHVERTKTLGAYL